ncbi:DEAD/DEAH box helicase [Gordonia spumicola]|uniref:DEAD/DEAH box helicase n=1 Tax=Gordonia spumicola TaxID=589161 RepID=A0A7I9V9D7_9ACTN|nr:ATP-dependent helicase [Gordonia spumicola]GEE02008.1 DEAD/DEAH box helicase [Gordonia spumicola]
MQPATREWFTGAFAAPTPVQLGAWDSISKGDDTLVVAPTGSGKTLAAFLWAIDTLTQHTGTRTGVSVLYISPLKALGVDVERNLAAPLTGIAHTAARMGLEPPRVTVGVRSGDTSAADRRALAKTPPDILITTPESLYLMLTSSARETLTSVHTVIVDEVHAVASTKRGTHLALSLERLDDLLDERAQRIGLSATVRPEERVAEFLSGSASCTVVKPRAAKTFDLRVDVPVDDMTNIPAPPSADLDGLDDAFSPTAGSLWPFIEESIVDEIEANRSTIVFANSRRLAERLTARLNEIAAARAGDAVDLDMMNPQVPGGMPSMVSTSGTAGGAAHVLARAHHGSVSKDQRASIEDDLKSGRLRCVVATSSLELGIDMGAVDLVIQVEAPPSVASGLQRIGRAGHQVGEISNGVLYPKHRTDLIHCTVTVDRMVQGKIESLSVPANPLDILAQQTIAAAAAHDVDVDDWFDTVRRAMPYKSLTRDVYDAVLDLISGRYPSDEFAELRPRVDYDRSTGVLTARRGTLRLAVTSGGTIPDRGLFGVFLAGSSSPDPGAASSDPRAVPERSRGAQSRGQLRRVGELDEEMVYESRVGDVFALGASSWRIEEITHDRVLVSPAFGQPGRLPFWIGDAQGRPAELGEAIGRFVGQASDERLAAQAERLGLSERARANLSALLAEQREATGALPTDRTLIVERFRDELGDWRLVLHSPYGLRVHAPWASAIASQLSTRLGLDGATTATDDGIIVRLPDTDDAPPGAEVFTVDPDAVEDLVTRALAESSMFASRFRECAARALLLPRRDPGRRAPLWQQRQRSAQLLSVASQFPDFPIILETVRECLSDVYDLPALIDLLSRIASRKVRVAEVETASPSPFAASMLLGYVGAFMYDDDAPLAERRATALSLDTALLAQLLGRVDLRELLDPGVIADVVARLQRTAPERRARDTEDVGDLLRWLGPLTADQIARRCTDDVDPASAVRSLLDSGRAIEIRHRGRDLVAIVDDAARLRDGLGVPLPLGVPADHLVGVPDPIGDLVHRFARTHGPFTADAVVDALGMAPAVVDTALEALASRRLVIEGEFLQSDGPHRSQWCHADVLGQLRRGSLAAGRADVEPVSPQVYARFLLEWQHLSGPSRLHGTAGVAEVIEQLAGHPIPASAWETLVLPARVSDYTPAMLDELLSSGEVCWSGHGAIGGSDGWVALHLADAAPLTLRAPDDLETTALHDALLDALDGGALRAAALLEATGADEPTVTAALWELVWSGRVTNDSFTVIRAALSPSRSSSAPAHRTRGRVPRLRSARLSSRYLAGVDAGTRTSPLLGGRWSALRRPVVDPTAEAAATCEILLDRYGVVTKGSVTISDVDGGFSRVYKALTVFEDGGQVRRGYYVDGLGGAQFAAGSTVDRLRDAIRVPRDRQSEAVLLAATDPANPYGAALDWPSTPDGHRPGRKAGAVVVLVSGALTAFVERGGKTVLTFTDDAEALHSAAVAVAEAVRAGRVPRIHIDQVDQQPVMATTFGVGLADAGFASTPRGLRMNYDPRMG